MTTAQAAEVTLPYSLAGRFVDEGPEVQGYGWAQEIRGRGVNMAIDSQSLRVSWHAELKYQRQDQAPGQWMDHSMPK